MYKVWIFFDGPTGHWHKLFSDRNHWTLDGALSEAAEALEMFDNVYIMSKYGYTLPATRG